MQGLEECYPECFISLFSIPLRSSRSVFPIIEPSSVHLSPCVRNISECFVLIRSIKHCQLSQFFPLCSFLYSIRNTHSKSSSNTSFVFFQFPVGMSNLHTRPSKIIQLSVTFTPAIYEFLTVYLSPTPQFISTSNKLSVSTLYYLSR